VDIRQYVNSPWLKQNVKTQERYRNISCGAALYPTAEMRRVARPLGGCNELRPTPVWSHGNSTLWGGSAQANWTDAQFSAALSVYSDQRKHEEQNIAWTNVSHNELAACGFFRPKHEYLYIVGLNGCLRKDPRVFFEKTQQSLILGILFLERELFGRGDVAANVVVECASGVDRTFAFLVFYMCVKFIAMHHGLSHFSSVDELWRSQSNQVFRLRQATNRTINHRQVWIWPAIRLLRDMVQPKKWKSNYLSLWLPSIYALPKASNISRILSATKLPKAINISLVPSSTMTIVTVHGRDKCLP